MVNDVDDVILKDLKLKRWWPPDWRTCSDTRIEVKSPFEYTIFSRGTWNQNMMDRN